MTTANSSVFVTVAAVAMLLASIVGIAVFLRFAAPNLVGKAKPKELRLGAAFIAFMPLWGALFVYCGASYLDKAGPVVLWFYVMGAIFVLTLWLWIWTRFVPAKVSWCIGGIIWSVTLWLAFTNRLT